LQEEVDRYNNHQVHPTTKENSSIRFDKAQRTGNTLFRSLSVPKPYTSLKDVLCLRETRMANIYRRVSLFNHDIRVPNVPFYEYVEIHLVPDTQKRSMRVRIWWKDQMVQSVTLPLQGFRVHFSIAPSSSQKGGCRHSPYPCLGSRDIMRLWLLGCPAQSALGLSWRDTRCRERRVDDSHR